MRESIRNDSRVEMRKERGAVWIAVGGEIEREREESLDIYDRQN